MPHQEREKKLGQKRDLGMGLERSQGVAQLSKDEERKRVVASEVVTVIEAKFLKPHDIW